MRVPDDGPASWLRCMRTADWLIFARPVKAAAPGGVYCKLLPVRTASRLREWRTDYRPLSKDLRMTPTSGTIKRITDKGFGFIAAADGTEYFFHNSACTSTPVDSMRDGDNVRFPL